jgi:hypothetical protein
MVYDYVRLQISHLFSIKESHRHSYPQNSLPQDLRKMCTERKMNVIFFRTARRGLRLDKCSWCLVKLEMWTETPPPPGSVKFHETPFTIPALLQTDRHDCAPKMDEIMVTYHL